MKIDWKPADFQVPQTLSETIFQSLKKAVIDGDIKPGQRLQEKRSPRSSTSATPSVKRFSGWPRRSISSSTPARKSSSRTRPRRRCGSSPDRPGPRHPRPPQDPAGLLGRRYRRAPCHDPGAGPSLRLRRPSELSRAEPQDRRPDLERLRQPVAVRDAERLMSKISIYRRKTDFAPFSDPRRSINPIATTCGSSSSSKPATWPAWKS